MSKFDSISNLLTIVFKAEFLFSEYGRLVFKFWELSLRCFALFSLAFEAYEFMVLMLEASAFHSVVYLQGKSREACYIAERSVVFYPELEQYFIETTKRNCTTEEDLIMSLSGPEHDVFCDQIYPIDPYITISIRIAFWIAMIWITAEFYFKQRSVDCRVLELTIPPMEKFQNACKNADQENIRKLFYKYQSEITINEPLANGNTVLHEAILTRTHGTAKALLKNCHHHLDFSVLSSDGFQYLDSCILNSDLDMLRILMKHIKPLDRHLHLAITEENVKMTEELMSKLNVPKSPSLKVTFARFSQMPSDLKRKQSLHKCINGIEVNDVHVIFSCTNCFCDMFDSDCKIFACKNDHFICQECQTKPIQKCVHCNVEFSKRNVPKRRISAERIREELKTTKSKIY